MNLDGGGSTTMFLDGKLMNKPSDKEGERNVSDAILVTLRNRK
jgi:exopolysaccharide biosynthesis protein